MSQDDASTNYGSYDDDANRSVVDRRWRRLAPGAIQLAVMAIATVAAGLLVFRL